jgi:hypothetical protein
VAKSSERITGMTPKFRVSYPNVFEPRLNDQSGKMEYTMVALFEKGANLDELKALVKKAAEAEFGTDQKKWPKNLRSPFRDQGEREKELEDGTKIMPEGYVKGAVFINLKNKVQPGLVDADRKAILDPAEFYAGCWARATVSVFGYSKGSPGVAIWMNNVQKLADGEPISGRPRAEDEFAAVSGGAETGGGEDATSIF